MTIKTPAAHVVTEAAVALHEEMSKGMSLSYAAAYLRQHSVNRHNPYGAGNTPATRWSYQLARYALRKLVSEGLAKKYIGPGQRQAEVDYWARA